jgi:sugar lactone lactonase YvrE
MKSSLLGLLLLLAIRAAAHPGVGIVQDAQGNVYYTDLENVWKRAPNGQQRIVVPRVHTHELYLDLQGNLYGEHAWYEGEATNKWGYYVWRISPGGQLSKVIPETPGFLTNYSFNRDQTGAMYWVERGTPCRFLKRLPGGKAQLLATGSFTDVRWQHVTPKGRFYFVNDDALYTLDADGTIRCLKRNLDEVPPSTAKVNHNLGGIFSDQHGNIYVAVTNRRKVQRLSPGGHLTTVARSSAPWTASSGLMAPNGDLWLLEYNTANQVRVRRVQPLQ